MVVAGNETTTKLLANAAYWGFKNPDQLAPVFDDHSLVKPWVEETLRYDASSQILARLVSADTTLYDTTIPAGDVLLLLPGSGNRDERAFDEPGRLPHRPRHRVEATQFRERGTLLPRRPPGQNGGSGGPHRTVQTDQRLRGGRGQLGSGPLQQRPRFRPSPHHRKGPLMPRFAPLPDRRPAIVAGASAGIGEATAIELAVPRLSRRARRPPCGEARRPGRQDPRRRWRSRRLPPRRHRSELGEVLRSQRR